MVKHGVIFLCVIALCLILFGGCKVKQNKTKNQSVINYTRKYESLLGGGTVQKKSGGSVVDLSEGPRLNYDAKFGPKELNFDMKIASPY